MKRTTFFVMCNLLISIFSFGQISTEIFETESHNSSSFTDNGVIFNINSQVATFDIQANYPGTGWNGTSMDNRYIDNSNSSSSGASFSINTTSNLFKATSFWIFLSNASLNQNVLGSLTVTGKLSGVTKFMETKLTGFATSLGTTNGYTFVDLANLNGQNYSSIVIDELHVILGGAYTYAGLDAFTWVKDSNVVLASNETKAVKNKTDIYPNPTTGEFSIKTDKNSRLYIYSESGQLVKTIEAKAGVNETDISELPHGVYIIKSSSESYKVIKK